VGVVWVDGKKNVLDKSCSVYSSWDHPRPIRWLNWINGFILPGMGHDYFRIKIECPVDQHLPEEVRPMTLTYDDILGG
jgi:hypothetical protein